MAHRNSVQSCQSTSVAIQVGRAEGERCSRNQNINRTWTGLGPHSPRGPSEKQSCPQWLEGLVSLNNSVHFRYFCSMVCLKTEKPQSSKLELFSPVSASTPTVRGIHFSISPSKCLRLTDLLHKAPSTGRYRFSCRRFYRERYIVSLGILHPNFLRLRPNIFPRTNSNPFP